MPDSHQHAIKFTKTAHELIYCDEGHKYNAFYNSNLADTFKALKKDHLIITGVYSHIGCMATALDALMRDIQVFLLAMQLEIFFWIFICPHLQQLVTAADIFP